MVGGGRRWSEGADFVKSPACPICRTRVRLDAGVGFSSAEDLEDGAKWWWGFDRNNGLVGM